MPRDSGGTYTLPGGSTATTGTTILASEHNTPLADIASALTGSLPVDGSKGMSGPFKAADGSAANPSITFGSNTVTGFFRKALNVIGIAINGTEVASIDSGGVIGLIAAGTIASYAGYTAPAGWLRSDGSLVSRATYATLFGAITATGNAIKDGTTNVLNSVDKDFTSYGFIGAYVGGSGIATGTTITALTSSTITLSSTPSAAGAVAIRILPHGQGDGSTTFALPDLKGRTIAGRESSSTRLTTGGSGINGAILGATGGEQTHTLSAGEMPVHNHSATDSGHAHAGLGNTQFLDPNGTGGVYAGGSLGTARATTNPGAASITVGNAGSGNAHNNVQPTIVLNYIIKT